MPSRPFRTPLRHRLARPLAGTAAGALLVLMALLVTTLSSTGTTETDDPVALAAKRNNPPTPGNFTGLGFDQCETQSQAKMDAWLASSPYRAVGVYISGNSRACKVQSKLTSTWVSTQLAQGWKILPITLGPQSSCVGRFPRYGATIDPTIINDPTSGYAAARAQGSAEADSAVAAAQALGIVAGSTLFYDLEGWALSKANAKCTEPALAFLSAWTTRVRQLGYVSGVYSSAGSGMKVLDQARMQARADIALPDRIWIARWDGVANTSTSYIAEDGWRPGGRMKQFKGGHNETWGGVTINIDSNYLEFGDSVAPPRCGGVQVVLKKYKPITPRKAGRKQVTALKCLLSEKGLFTGKMGPKYTKKTRHSAKAWQAKVGHRVKDKWGTKDWASLLNPTP